MILSAGENNGDVYDFMRFIAQVDADHNDDEATKSGEKIISILELRIYSFLVSQNRAGGCHGSQ